jgi:hypothetical protein
MKNRHFFQSRGVLILVLFLIVLARLSASDYYVNQGHAAANDQNPGTIDQPWKTITKANQTLVAGDTVYIVAGTYTSHIAPANSGTSSNRITYRNYGTDRVIIQNAAYGIRLNGKSYVTVQGIDFYNLDRFLYLENSANNNIIAYCNFDQMRTFADWAGSRIWKLSSFNWIHHCSFSNYGGCISGEDEGTVLEIGYDDGDESYCGNDNLIEDCTLFNGGHHVLGVIGKHNIIRNNYLYNAAWSNGKGNRTLYLNGYEGSSAWNLIEGNRFGYSYVPCDSWGAPGTQVSTEYNIMRYNAYFYNSLAGVELSTTSNYHSGPNFNKVYNNSFNDNGWDGSPDPQSAQISFCAFSGFTVRYNAIKNNLFRDAPQDYGFTGTNAGYQTFAGNYSSDVSGDPKFVNATSSPGSPSDTTYPDLNLQAGSPAIDRGTYLTNVAVADSGAGSSILVDEAGYFQDGSWTPQGTLEGDWIAVGTVTNVAQIMSINYSTGTITLSQSINRSDGDPVWLYKKSDGIRVLYGSAPDAGAYEFPREAAKPTAPKNLRIKTP